MPKLKLGFVLLLSAFVQGGAYGDPCSAHLDCKACAASSYTCHWCGDNSCHAVGSPYGCLVGTSCYDNDQCQRPAPEYTGYGAPPLAAILGVLLVGGSIMMCGVYTVLLARDYAKAARGENGDRRDYYSALGDSSDDEEYTRPSAPLPPTDNGTDSKKPLRPVSMRHLRVATPRSHTTRPRGYLATRVYSFARLVCGLILFMTAVCAAIVLAFAPRTPLVNVCNTQFDWGSIVHSMKKLAVEADFQILVSIENPNYLDVNIHGGVAVFRHKHVEVGQMVLDPFTAVAGHISDILFTVAFDGKTWDELGLGVEYATGELAFLLDATVTASVGYRGHSTFPFTFSISNYYIKVANATAYDRSLCHCADMSQASNPQAHALTALTLPDIDTNIHHMYTTIKDAYTTDSYYNPNVGESMDMYTGGDSDVYDSEWEWFDSGYSQT